MRDEGGVAPERSRRPEMRIGRPPRSVKAETAEALTPAGALRLPHVQRQVVDVVEVDDVPAGERVSR